MKKIKVLSLFNGISCGRVALERAGIEVERYVSYEIDEKANFVARKNYPQDEYNGDVFKADFTQYKGFDLLIGGSPCTYWSIAKSRWGNRETTSEGIGFELFKQYVRALEESGCRYFLYENNNSISDEIKTEITKILGVQPITIDSAIVSAQNRKRCYWTNISGVKQPKDRMIKLQDILESGTAYQKKAYCLTASYGGVVLWNSLERSQRTMVAEIDTTSGIEVKNGKIRLSHKNRAGEEITKDYKIGLENGYYSFRKMTLVEIERLQTLPDNYTEGIDTQTRYKVVGNGWTVDIIAHILGYLKIVRGRKRGKRIRYKYYSIQSPVSAGIYPKPRDNPAMLIHNFNERQYVAEIGRLAWGYIEYDKPLENADIDGYELIPAAFFS